MPSLLNLVKSRSESRTLSEQPGRASFGSGGKNNDGNVNIASTKSQAGKRRSERAHAHPRSTKRSHDDGGSARRSTNHQRSAALASLYRKPGSDRASARHSGSEEDDDDIIKWSMYPQLIGKRRSEIIRDHDRALNRSRALNTSQGHAVTEQPTNHTTRQQLSEHRSQRSSAELGLSYDSGYASEDVLGGRPTRVCVNSQGKYCEVPGKMPAHPQQRDSFLSSDDTPSSDCYSYTPSPRKSWNNTYRPGGLPHDEYRILVRRQQMQRVREMLEKHFEHCGKRQYPRVWHGLKQGYQIRNSERRRISKINYAVRKALKAKFDILSNDYELARYRHGAKIPYCELSDVDGVLLSHTTVNDFIRAFQQAQDDAYVPKLTPLPYGEPFQRTWIDERIRQTAPRRRVDSGIVMEDPVKFPQPVSKFSWDSDSDEEVCERKRLTKVKR